MVSVPAVIFAGIAIAASLSVWRSRAGERRRSDARVAALASVIDPAREGDPTPLFDAKSAVTTHSLVKFGAGAAVVGALIFIVAIVSDAREPRGADPAHSADVDATPIALVTMGHVRRGDSFVIHGIVRNQGARRIDGLYASIVALDAAGQTVATGRAPIEEQSLAPAESSRFDVRLDGVRAVERYRISFRGPEGVVRHLDVRSHATRPAARTGDPSAASTGF
jgi:hypothetical protein